MPIKTLGSLGKIRVGRITGNTHIFWPKQTIVLVGTNDVASSQSVQQIMSSLQDLITKIRTKSSTNLLICGMIPRPCDLYADPKEIRMKDVNKDGPTKN